MCGTAIARNFSLIGGVKQENGKNSLLILYFPMGFSSKAVCQVPFSFYIWQFIMRYRKQLSVYWGYCNIFCILSQSLCAVQQSAATRTPNAKDWLYYVHRMIKMTSRTFIKKADVQAKTGITLMELYEPDLWRADLAFPTRYVALTYLVHLCLHTFYIVPIIYNSFFATYIGNVLFLLKKGCNVIYCT